MATSVSPVKPRLSFSLAELADRFGGHVLGNADTRIERVATLDTTEEKAISFLANPKYRQQLQHTKAVAVLLGERDADASDRPRIICDNPYAYFAKVSDLLNPVVAATPGIHGSAVVDASATVAKSASLGPHVSLSSGVIIGEGVKIEAGCTIGADVTVGQATHLFPNVTIYAGCTIGARVILHSGVVIGADGFGIASENGRWIKVPQIGAVEIGDDVEIGANTTVDRGALGNTVIEEGVKLDNQIQIGHNVRIGAHTAMAGCVGIAGSARIGRHCTVGGGAIILGHLTIADNVHVSAGTLVTKSIDVPGQYGGAYPFGEQKAWLKNAVLLRNLDKMAERIAALEKEIQGKKK